MKKLILGTLALIGICCVANANILTVTNHTNCNYDIGVGGIGGPSTPTIATPGITKFGTASSNIGGVKIMFPDVNGAIIQLNVGTGSPFASSSGLPAPACSTPFNYVTAIWQVDANGDVYLTIM